VAANADKVESTNELQPLAFDPFILDIGDVEEDVADATFCIVFANSSPICLALTC